MDDNKYIKLNFTYIDEFDQESTLNKTLSTCVFEDTDELEVLLDEFKLFLIGSGFSNRLVDKIIYKNSDE